MRIPPLGGQSPGIILPILVGVVVAGYELPGVSIATGYHDQSISRTKHAFCLELTRNPGPKNDSAAAWVAMAIIS